LADCGTESFVPTPIIKNGVVERKYRHMVELGLTLLQQASLPLKFWDFAFLTAVYLKQITHSLSFFWTAKVVFIR